MLDDLNRADVNGAFAQFLRWYGSPTMPPTKPVGGDKPKTVVKLVKKILVVIRLRCPDGEKRGTG